MVGEDEGELGADFGAKTKGTNSATSRLCLISAASNSSVLSYRSRCSLNIDDKKSLSDANMND